jgi:hypothetical protein
LRNSINNVSESFIDFGFADTTAMVNSSSIVYMNVYNDIEGGTG